MKHSIFTFLVFITCQMGYSQVLYHDINPDTTVSTWDAFTIAPFGGAHTGSGSSIDIWHHPSPEVVVTCWNNFQVVCNSSPDPLKLNAGDSISATSGNWQTVSYQPLVSGSTGVWQTDAIDKYLGFRIKNGSTWNYGWIKMTVATSGTSFTVKEWALNESGNKIKAGQTSAAGIENIITNKEQIIVTPNPATNLVQVSLPQNANNDIIIRDYTGKTVYHTVSDKKILTVSIHNYPAGIYTIYCNGYTGKFIKQ